MAKKIDDILNPPPPPSQKAILDLLEKATAEGLALQLPEIVYALENGQLPQSTAELVIWFASSELVKRAAEWLTGVDPQERRQLEETCKMDLEALVDGGKVREKDGYFWFACPSE